MRSAKFNPKGGFAASGGDDKVSTLVTKYVLIASQALMAECSRL